MRQNSSLYILILVGLVSAFGPFVTDFYLPALPAMGDFFHTSASMVQLTLTVSMVGLATGQLFIGPLSDRYGRKIPLICSLVLFVISTIGCLTSATIGTFILARFVQGLAGAGGVVISKAIATDLYQGKQLSRFFAMLSSVQGIAPICAPVLGGVMLTFTDWHGVFFALLALGIALLLGVLPFHESLPRTARLNHVAPFAAYRVVLCNGGFMRYVGVQALAMGVMFAYIGSSPFIFQQHFGVSPLVYSLCFGVNALAIMAGSLLIAGCQQTAKVLKIGCCGFATLSVGVAATLSGGLSLSWVEPALFVLLFFLGMILPTSTTLALERVRENSGSGAAVMGFMTFFAGGICSPLAGLGNMLHATSLIVVVCAVGSLVLLSKKFHTFVQDNSR